VNLDQTLQFLHKLRNEHKMATA